MDAEEEVSLSAAFGGAGNGLAELGRVSPELVELAKRAYRLRAAFDQPAALVMPFELEIR
jgi:hypothetical protein